MTQKQVRRIILCSTQWQISPATAIAGLAILLFLFCCGREIEAATVPTISYGSGFSAGTMALNGSAALNGTRLRLTDGGPMEAASAFYPSAVNVQNFTNDFSFQLTNPSADGIMFVLQNQGPSALGGFGINLGFGGVQKSIGIKFDLYNNAGEGVNSTGLYLNGASPTMPATDLSPSGLNLHSGDVFQAHMSYNGTTLSVTLTDSMTGANATQSYTVNIPATVGSNTAYPGFTAGTGGQSATQDILSWSMTPAITSSGTSYGSGFSAGTMALNGSAALNGTRLRLTDGGPMEAASAFYPSAVNVQNFTNDFSFQLTNPSADGIMFVLQNQGPSALGGFGINLGFGGVQKSIGIKFDLYNNAGEGVNSTGLYLNGASPTMPATDLSPSGLNLHSGDVFQAHMSYNGTTLSVTLTDSMTGANATQSYTVNIPATVGSNTAYPGFTAGTGGQSATQDILSWSMTPNTATSVQGVTSLTVSPSTATLTASQARQFTATVVNASSAAVTWSLNPSVGSISSTGLYTAPSLISSAQTVTVTVTSGADQTKTANASISLAPAPVVASRLVFLNQPASAVAESPLSPGIQVALEDANGNIATSMSTPVTITLPGSRGLMGTVTVTPQNGVATFSALAVRSAGTGYQLQAQSTNLASATSHSFTVTAPSGLTPILADTADSLVDSVGIDVHLGYTNTAYGNFPSVTSALQFLKVRHIRDGLGDTTWQPYYDEHNQLGQMGIKSIFLITVGQSAALFQAYPGRMAQCFEAFEGPNEYDVSGNANWATNLQATMSLLYSSVHSAFGTQYPIIGPSLTQVNSYPTLGNQSALLDYTNMHNYPGGRNPGTLGWGGPDAQNNYYGSIPYNEDEVSITAPNAPVITTETGYTNNPALVGGYVTQPVAAVYMPRVPLEQWRAGVKRTYLYELVTDTEDFGLYNADWSPKPAAPALANLLTLLNDQGAAFQPSTLTFSVQGGDANLHHLLFQKRDGSFYLALWEEVPSFDPNQGNLLPVTPESVVLHLGGMASLSGTQWTSTGQITSTNYGSASSLNLSVSDNLLLIKVVPN